VLSPEPLDVIRKASIGGDDVDPTINEGIFTTSNPLCPVETYVLTDDQSAFTKTDTTT
jgi:hypothetical protein